MKKILFVLAFSFCQVVYGADVIRYDVNTNYCLEYLPSIDETPYLGVNGYMVFTDRTSQTIDQVRALLKNSQIIYFKRIGNPQIAEKTKSEKLSTDQSIDYEVRKGRRESVRGTVKKDLLIQALIKVLSEETGKTEKEIQDRIDTIVSEKLQLIK